MKSPAPPMDDLGAFDDTRTAIRNLDAERGVLGSMLLSGTVAEELLDQLDAGEFHEYRHTLIFTAILDLYTSGRPIDPVTVGDRLQRTGDLNRVGGAPYLFELMHAVPNAASGSAYAEIVSENAAFRLADEFATRAQQAVRSTHGSDLAELVDRIDGEWAKVKDAVARVSSRASVLDAVCPDLGPFIDGTHTMPEPTIGRREDGAGLFYAGEVNRVFGKSESGKTWLTLYAGLQHLGSGGDLVFCDYENGPAAVVPRLLALGATPELLRSGRFRYLDLRDAVLSADMRSALAEAHTGAVVIVDSVAGLVASHAKSSNYVDDIEALLTRDLAVFTRAGHCVILIDHESDRADGSGRSSGSHRKRDLISGVSLRVDPVNPFRKWNPGGDPDGRSRVYVDKDRHGGVRAVSVRVAGDRDHLGDFTGRPSQDGRLSCRLWWPELPAAGSASDAGQDTPEHYARILLAAGLPDGYGRPRLKTFIAEHGIKIPGRDAFLGEVLAAVKTLRQADPE